MIDREERILRILDDWTKEVDLLNDSDIDRLLASLAGKPVKEFTRDYDDVARITTWFEDRYPKEG